MDISLWHQVHADLLSAINGFERANSWWGSERNPDRHDPAFSAAWKEKQTKALASHMLRSLVTVMTREELAAATEKAYKDSLVLSVHNE
jgi:hypothetical protein